MEFRELTRHNAGYKVSECGTVIISPKTGRKIAIQNNTVKGKISGYKYISLLWNTNIDGLLVYSIKRTTCHRIVCELWHGMAPDGKPWVNHKDGDKANNHYTNLEWTSISDNIKHSYDVLNRARPNHMLGFKHSEATINKLKLIAKKGKEHPSFKGYWMHNEIRYLTLREAGENNGVSGQEIQRRVKKNINGWHFVPKRNKRSTLQSNV